MTDSKRIKLLLAEKCRCFEKIRNAKAGRLIEKFNSGRYLNRRDIDELTSFVMDVDTFTMEIIKHAELLALNNSLLAQQYSMLVDRWEANEARAKETLDIAKAVLETPYSLRAELGGYYDEMVKAKGQNNVDQWEKEIKAEINQIRLDEGT